MISINAAAVLGVRSYRAMRPNEEPTLDRVQTLRAWGAGVALSVAAASAVQALAHQKAISALGAICGQGPSPHCAWCVLGLIAATTGLTLLIQGMAPTPNSEPG